MNRQDLITRTLMLESVAKEAMARAARFREALAADARAELKEQGTAPTWRLPEIGTVTLPVTQESVYVADEAALIEWTKRNFASEVETTERLRPAFTKILLGSIAQPIGEVVIDDTGVVIPGLAVRHGGTPMALSFRPSKDAQAIARAAAEKLVGDVEEALGGPLILAEVPDA